MFAQACKMLILEMTVRSWYEAMAKDRRTVQKEDVYESILKADVYDFLIDVVNGVLDEENKSRKKPAAAAGAAGGTKDGAAAAAGTSGHADI